MNKYILIHFTSVYLIKRFCVRKKGLKIQKKQPEEVNPRRSSMTGEHLVKETFNHIELFVHIPDSHNPLEECRNNLNQIKQKGMQWKNLKNIRMQHRC